MILSIKIITLKTLIKSVILSFHPYITEVGKEADFLRKTKKAKILKNYYLDFNFALCDTSNTGRKL